MKISASYNYFNADEHLLASIKSIRSEIDHISIVWQSISNSGEAISAHALNVLDQIERLNIVDEVLHFEADLNLRRSENELSKRSIGLEMAKRADATHFLSMDADEFYRKEELRNARKLIENHGYVSTSVGSYLHLKSPRWRALDTTCCCFITEIAPESIIGAQTFPHPNIDPTRKLSVFRDGHHHFDVDVVAMYHMNLVRRDLGQKLRNSSTTDVEFLSRVALAVESWRPGEIFTFPNKGDIKIEEVGNEFLTFDPLGDDVHR